MKKYAYLFLILMSITCFIVDSSYAQGASLIPDGSAQTIDPTSNAVEPEPAFGTSATFVQTVFAWDFANWYPGTSPSLSTIQGERYCSTTGCGFLAGINLPSGVMITKIELDLCDSSDTESIDFASFIAASPMGGSFVYLTIWAGTGEAQTPGCGIYSIPLSTPHTVDNLANTYFLDIFPGTSSNASFTAVRIFYQYQISPAPGTATFSDVPLAHPFFQHIEALAASGITTGYGDGTYRPGDYVTRAAMAAYFARALGLHWPN